MENNQNNSSSSDTEEDSILLNFQDIDLMRYLYSILHSTPSRNKLENFTTIQDLVQAIKDSKSILIVCGAGVSVSCGIPDFRSKDGLYARLGTEYPELSSPADIFSLDFFRSNPQPFFKFFRDLFFDHVQPGVAHRFVRALECAGKLLTCYTQNVDGLDRLAGTENLIECHGSFRYSTCMDCGFKEETDKIHDIIVEQKVPICSSCGVGVMKPDIVFFGEQLSGHFYNKISEDVKNCDLFMVIGSSMSVSPVSSIPRQLPDSVPQILVNRQALPSFTFDVELLGDCDVILSHLSLLLGDGFSELSSLEKTPELCDISDLNGSEITRDDVFFHSRPSKYFYRNAQDIVRGNGQDLESSSED